MNYTLNASSGGCLTHVKSVFAIMNTPYQPFCPRITAIVCTYNRASSLHDSLLSLFNQSLSPCDYEVIVVDNASTDSTPEVVQHLIVSHPAHSIKYFCELRQGLSYARNKGISCASAPILCFTDDDCLADFYWLEALLATFQQYDKSLLVVCGQVSPNFISKRPQWFPRDYEAQSFGMDSTFLTPNQPLPSGCNLAFRSSTFSKYGLFRTGMGMCRNQIGLGEDSEYLLRIFDDTSTSSSILYCPNAHIYHQILPNRLKLKYQLKRSIVTGYFSLYTAHNNSPFARVFAIRSLLYLSLNTFNIPAFAGKSLPELLFLLLVKIAIVLGALFYILGRQPLFLEPTH